MNLSTGERVNQMIILYVTVCPFDLKEQSAALKNKVLYPEKQKAMKSFVDKLSDDDNYK
jgi:hypothetical protein